ncbi:MAG: hypothetical protein MI749_06605, partial [Desulfovibrionales bacterium]|nr:hypothetical protein [Desulfovibrionales bacterium]
MALRTHTNVAALNAHTNMVRTDDLLSSSLGRLSSGLRINRAADDASGMIIADSLRAQHMGIGQAIKNANDGISIVQTADGALQESINIINTIKTKAIQAASDGQTTSTRTAIQNDIDKLLAELDIIAQTTSFNGQKLLSGAFTNKSIQIGAYSNETASISIGSTESSKIGHVKSSQLSLAGDGGNVQLTITSALTGDKLTLNEVDIQKNNQAQNGMGALADEINRYSSTTGISAMARVSVTTSSPISAGTTGSDFAINGVTIGAVEVQNNDSDQALLTAINGKTAEHGITAALEEDGRLTLTSSDGRAIEVTGAVSDVFNSTAAQMSTIGFLELTQSGVSQFQINGIGAGATGVDIDLRDGEVYETVEDSILASGSTIVAGSQLAAGSYVGGDVYVEATDASSQLTYEMKTGSTIAWGSDLSKGTILGAQITVGGSIDSTAVRTTTALDQDMLATTGSTLQEGTILGQGTIITTNFSANGNSYSIGDTLSASVTLDADVTLQADMNLKYDGTNNSEIAAGSTLAAGSILGADFDDVGLVFNTALTSGSYATSPTTVAATTTDLYLQRDSDLVATTTAGGGTIEAGSILADASEIVLASSSLGATTIWTGPTLNTTTGTIEAGDTIQTGTEYTLDGTQKISQDLTYAEDSTNTLKAGTVLVAGFTMGSGDTIQNTTAAGSITEVELTTDTTLTEEMTLVVGSSLETGSKLVAGSKLGDDTYIMGSEVGATVSNVSTYQRTELKAGSRIFSVVSTASTTAQISIIAEGSTVGGNLELDVNETLESDMTVKSGTILRDDTVIKAGTVINQNMTFDSGTVEAGSALSQDMTLNGDVTLTTDLTLKEESIIAANSILALNTENAGTVGLSDSESFRLAAISVLTQAGAQRAIQIADAALKA